MTVRAGNTAQVCVPPAATRLGITTLIERFAVACRAGCPASVDWIVKLAVPDAVGVPAIRPVVGFSTRPAGSAPAVFAHVYGAFPPAAPSVTVYAVPTVAPGNDDVVSWSTDVTLIERFAVAFWVGSPASVAWTVKLDAPLAVGVPEITPVDASIESPGGNEPALSDHEYGPVPPVPATGAE